MVNDCRIVSPHNVKRGKTIDFEQARAFIAKLNDLKRRIGEALEAYEAEHGVDLSK